MDANDLRKRLLMTHNKYLDAEFTEPAKQQGKL